MAALRRRAQAYRAAPVKCFFGSRWLPRSGSCPVHRCASVVMLCLKQKQCNQPDAWLWAARVPPAQHKTLGSKFASCRVPRPENVLGRHTRAPSSRAETSQFRAGSQILEL